MDNMGVELSKKINERTREKELSAVVIFHRFAFSKNREPDGSRDSTP